MPSSPFSPSRAGRPHRAILTCRVLPGARQLPNLATIIACVMVLSFAVPARGEDQQAGGWSAELLNRILKAEPAKTDAPTAPMPATTPPAEMILRTYRFTKLRVGEAGKTQNVLAILKKLLPAGSSINADVQENSLHILTTKAAQDAAWEYLSAVDVADAATQATPATVPDDVKAALKKLAEAGDQSAKLLVAVGSLKADMSHEITQIEAKHRQQTLKLFAGGMLFAVALVGTAVWMLRRRPPTSTENASGESTALALAPEQLTTALIPVHDKMRNDMLGMLNEVAIKLQAQHNEQQKLVREQQQQLEDARHALAEERRQFISEAGTMVVQAVERVDATTAKLAKQQDKVAELVQELQNTVRELDQTKDSLRTKEVELEQERSKIAALSILLEEGGALPGSNGTLQNGRSLTNDSGASARSDDGSAEAAAPRPISPCTNPDQTRAPTTVMAGNARPAPTTVAPSAPRFQFLSPDHPET